MKSSFKPELLAPAGSLEKLKVAVCYGADAVYLSGQQYGMRAASENFTNYEIQQGVSFAHKQGVKAYVTLNAYMHDSDLESLGEFCQYLESINIDAVIVSDLGVARVIKKNSNLNIHLSTQTSCLNSYAAQVWKDLGVSRIVVARELSIKEAAAIKSQSDMAVEMFIHGAMCMSYSGHCTISNYTAGRDSNRGGCIQSCRFNYQHEPLKNSRLKVLPNNSIPTDDKYHFMSSKDLNGIELLDQFSEHKIDSLKIEGRMKSILYLASVCSAYREAIDKQNTQSIELSSLPNREFCTGSLTTEAGPESIYKTGQATKDNATHQLVGIVLDTDDTFAAIKLNVPITKGEEIEIFSFRNGIHKTTLESMQSLTGQNIEKIRQDSVVCIPKAILPADIEPFNIIRRAT